MTGSNRHRPRRAGVLIPLFSLRTDHGFGLGEIPDLAPYAEWAAAAGLRVVQMLPVAALNPGESSPYSAATAFAIDPAYMGLSDCEDFAAAGGVSVLSDGDRRELDEVRATSTVAWGRVRPLKERAMRAAFASFLTTVWKKKGGRRKELESFREENSEWLDDFALFHVLHEKFQAHWKDWEKPFAERSPAALAKVARDHREELLYVAWQQWQLDEQWRKARAHANALGVELMGDLPFVMSGDSADVWKDRHLFRAGMRVGVPPDALCADGQDWGLPLYDWAALAKTDFAWMHRRAARAGRMYGLYRVDHIIGMYRTYYRSEDGTHAGFSPVDEENQIQLGETLMTIMGKYGEVIAEDLGLLPEFLRPSLSRLRLPGYRVLRWEKDDGWRDGRHQSDFRDPATWPEISVATSGTHDTETQAAWYDQLSPDNRRDLFRLPGLGGLDPHRPFHDEARDALLGVLYGAASELCLLPFQDLLGHREQVNVPGTVNDRNWTYRMPMALRELLADTGTSARLYELAKRTRRTES